MLRRLTVQAAREIAPQNSRPVLDQLQDDQHVNEQMVARVTGLSLSWVRKQRLLKQGPPWRKLGKAVRYPVSGLKTWLASFEQH